MAANTNSVAAMLPALQTLEPIRHESAPNEITTTYGIPPGTQRAPVPIPSNVELENMKYLLEKMKAETAATARQLQVNMDTVGDFLKAQNAFVPQRAPSQEGFPMPKIRLVHKDGQMDKSKAGTPRPPVSGDPNSRRNKRDLSELLQDTAPPDAIYSGRVENTAVHITPDNKMKVIVYARGGSDSSKPKKPKNLNGVAAPKVKDGGTPAEDIYTSHHHPTVFGVPLDGDFTKLAKPQNQIPFDQFWKFADQFFRPIEEADLAWLQSPGEQMQIYAIPPLGKPYAQQWDDEDRLLSADPSTARTETEFRMDGDILVSGDAVLGPFTERTLQALVSEALLETGSVVSQTSDAETLVQPLPEYVGRTKQDLMDLEERIKVELQYIDLAPPSETPGGDSGDDEVTRELRRAQSHIKGQIEQNMRLKGQINEVALKWLAYQEYMNVKDELERQIDAAYMRRFRTIKKKKKAGEKPQTLYVRPVGGDNSSSLIAKRRKWIEKAGAAFDMSKVERTPIFQKLKDQLI